MRTSIVAIIIGMIWVIQVYAQSTSPVTPGSSTERALGTSGGSLPSQYKVIAGKNGSTVVPLEVDSTNSLKVSGIFSQSGRAVADTARLDYASTSVTTGAYVQIIATTAAATAVCDVFDSSGQTLFLAVGGSGSEIDQIRVVPGGNGVIPLKIAAGSRVSLKAISATASAGEFDINCYQ
jgi:hypothetical protein